MYKHADSSVADPDPVSGAFLTPGSGIQNKIFPEDNFLVKSYIILCKLAQNFFLHLPKKIK